MLYFTLTTVARLAADQGGSPTAGLVPTLLTGGGFAFLGIVMTGLFMWNKNKAESANSVAQGAATWAAGMSAELTAYKNWAGRQNQANREHTQWDDKTFDQLQELVAKCEEKGIIEPGSIKLSHPPSLDVPFYDPYTDPQLPKAK